MGFNLCVAVVWGWVGGWCGDGVFGVAIGGNGFFLLVPERGMGPFWPGGGPFWAVGGVCVGCVKSPEFGTRGPSEVYPADKLP